MALVKRLCGANGATVEIWDDAYRDASPEEIARRKEACNRVVSEIMLAAEERRIMKKLSVEAGA